MSILAIDVIDRLPDELAAALVCDPFFNDIPVVVAEKGNILAEIQRKQAVLTSKGGKSGVAVIVLQLTADDDEPNLAFGSMRLNPSLQVVENVEMNNGVNGTGKSARRVARKIRDVIKPLRLIDLTTDFVAEKNCIEPVTLASEIGKNVVAYQVNFYTYEADSEQISQVLIPEFSAGADPDNPTLVMASTPGATIYYTLDDSSPVPPAIDPESTAAAYAGEVPIPAAGFTVRARALKAGMIPSSVMRAVVSFDQTINP